MVDYCQSVAVKSFHEDMHAIYRVLSPPQLPSGATPNDYDGNAPLNLCIKSEDTTSKEENLNVRLNYVKKEQEAGRLRFYREEGLNSNTVKLEEYENGRHSSGESMDSGIFMQHADESNETLNNLQWHSNRNSVESVNIGGMVEQRHYSGDSMGDPCQELGNLLIVSTLDTDIANEEIVECVNSVDIEEADTEDNLIIDDNADAETDDRMEVTGNSIQSKYNDLKPEEYRDTILNRKYNYNKNNDMNMEKLHEYLVKEEVHEHEPSLLEHQFNTSRHPSSSPDDSSQDSLQLLAAASMERSATSTLEATAAVDYGDGLDGPLHLLAAIAMSAKANSDIEYKQLSAMSQTPTSSTSSLEADPSIYDTTSGSSMTADQTQPPAAAKRLRYHSWPQMATMTSSQRKKEQNKLASKRFRERKKQQIEQARIEIMELEVRNDLLKKKETIMKSEREKLRSILLEQNLIKIVKLPDGQTTVAATTEMPKRLSSA